MTIRIRAWQPALLACLGVLSGGARAGSAPLPAYLDTHLPARVRAADLVHRMTLREKASQLVNAARAIPRLGVPAYNWWSEALHGDLGKGTTEFPEPIGLGATFDAAGIHRMAHDIAMEGRVVHEDAVRAGGSTIFHGLDFWAPNVNIFRDPRWGRGQETYGEDPFLTARMAVAYVTGMQGPDPHHYLAISTPKHFDAHSGPESIRHFADYDVSRHDLEDTYLPAFRAAIVDGHAGSVMCAYTALNGEPDCANSFLLQHTLRGAWQFQGSTTSSPAIITGPPRRRPPRSPSSAAWTMNAPIFRISARPTPRATVTMSRSSEPFRRAICPSARSTPR
jgi:beta-glucosidase